MVKQESLNKLFIEKNAIVFKGESYNAIRSWSLYSHAIKLEEISWIPHTYYILSGSYTEAWWIYHYKQEDLMSIAYFSG